MSIGADLEDALRSFAQTERHIVALGAKLVPEAAGDFVALRRDLVMQFAKLGGALAQDPHLAAHPELMTQGTRLFSAFRTQNSINQADWPVVRVRDDVPGYRVAVKPLAERSAAFWQWIDQELDYRR